MTQNKNCPISKYNCDSGCAFFKDMDCRLLGALEDFSAAMRELLADRRQGKAQATGQHPKTGYLDLN